MSPRPRGPDRGSARPPAVAARRGRSRRRGSRGATPRTGSRSRDPGPRRRGRAASGDPPGERPDRGAPSPPSSPDGDPALGGAEAGVAGLDDLVDQAEPLVEGG